MTPVSLGPQPIDRVFVAPEGAVADRLDQALDAVERVYREPSERVVAREAVWQIIDPDPHPLGSRARRLHDGRVSAKSVGGAGPDHSTLHQSLMTS